MELTGRDETASERGVRCWVGGDVTCLPRQDLATACRGLGAEVGEQKEALGGVSAKHVFCRLDVCPGVRLETRHTPPQPLSLLDVSWRGQCRAGEGGWAASDVMSLPLISTVTLTRSLGVTWAAS